MVPVVLLFGGCSKSNPSGSNLSAPVITQQPQSQTATIGSYVQFVVKATCNPAATCQWRKNGTNISDTSYGYTYIVSSAGTSVSYYESHKLQLTDSGTYSVVVSNSEGSDTSNGAVLIVDSTGTPTGMLSIPGGTFQMGQPNPNLGGTGWSSDEQPVDTVTVSAFYMDKTDVTQADFQALMLVNPSNFTGDLLLPVETVTWFDAVLYCNKRSKQDGFDTVYSFTSVTGTPGNGCSDLGGLAMDFTKNGYRLPTEAEWEYACRAGTTTDYYWGKNYPPTTSTDTLAIDSNAVWYYNSPTGTQPVATKKPNAWGLYDMNGNVWEWCNDWYGRYTSGNQTDPTGPSTGSSRVLRGGSWVNGGVNLLRSAFRLSGDSPGVRYNSIGFRCVRR